MQLSDAVLSALETIVASERSAQAGSQPSAAQASASSDGLNANSKARRVIKTPTFLARFRSACIIKHGYHTPV